MTLIEKSVFPRALGSTLSGYKTNGEFGSGPEVGSSQVTKPSAKKQVSTFFSSKFSFAFL